MMDDNQIMQTVTALLQVIAERKVAGVEVQSKGVEGKGKGKQAGGERKGLFGDEEEEPSGESQTRRGSLLRRGRRKDTSDN